MKLDIQKFELDESASWNCRELEALLPEVATAAQQLDDALDTLSDGLEQLDDNWYSENAEQFGNSFGNAFKSLIPEINSYVNSCGRAIVSAGEAYAAAGNTSFSGSWSQHDARACSATFNVTDSSGRRGANAGADVTFDSVTNEGMSGVTSALTHFTEVVNSSHSFSAENNTALSSSVSQCNQTIDNWHKNNTAEFRDDATLEIKNFLETSQGVSSSFTAK